MLQHADLPDGFWPEAAIYANYLKNLLPLSDGKSPFERWFGYKPLIDAERTWGMLCKVFVPKEQRRDDGKLIPVAIDGIYMGVASTTQCRVYIPSKREVEVCTNVKVFENKRATHLLTGILTTTARIGSSKPAMTLTDPARQHYDGEYPIAWQAERHLATPPKSLLNCQEMPR